MIRHQTLALLLLLGITSCAGPIPKWDGKLWAGDSARSGITRAQEPDPAKRTILAANPRFDDYVAMSYEDFRSFMATYVYGCKQWRSDVPMMAPADAIERFRLLIDQWRSSPQGGPDVAPPQQ